MNRLLAIALLGLCAFAQSPATRGTPTTPSRTFPFGATQSIRVNVNGYPVYTCNAASDVGESVPLTISAATNASPVALTVTAHQFDYQSQQTAYPLVRISGFTGNWAGANGVWAAVPTDANTITIPFDSSVAAAMTGKPILTTRSPRKTDPVWAIQRNVFDADGTSLWSGFAVKASGAGGGPLPTSPSVNYGLQCVNLTTRTDYAYQ